MLQDSTGVPPSAVGDTFVIHMDRESLNDFPLGKYDVSVEITRYEPAREIAWKDANVFPIIPESALRATLGILARTVEKSSRAAD